MVATAAKVCSLPGGAAPVSVSKAQEEAGSRYGAASAKETRRREDRELKVERRLSQQTHGGATMLCSQAPMALLGNRVSGTQRSVRPTSSDGVPGGIAAKR